MSTYVYMLCRKLLIAMIGDRYYNAECPACGWTMLGATTDQEAIDAASRHYHAYGRPHQATVSSLARV